MSLSSITISGTVTKNPEKRFTPSNIPVTNFVIEVTFIPRGLQSGQQKEIRSQNIRVNAWRDLANECESSIKSGDKVLVIGKAQVNAYTSNDGKRKREIEIDATSIILLTGVIAIQLPKKEELVSASSKVSTSEVEQTTNLEEALTSTEEIPF